MVFTFHPFFLALCAWLLGFTLTYSIWGVWAVVIGFLFFLGGGFVPIALLATAIHGDWYLFFALLVVTILTFAARIIGVWLINSAPVKVDAVTR